MNSINVVVNTRILAAPATGVHRTLNELMAHLPAMRKACPTNAVKGPLAHIWEQVVLPTQVKTSLLWSPSNTGPLSVDKQVLTLHDVVPIDHPEWLNPKFAAWCRWLTPKLARKVRQVVTVSDFTRQRIVEHTGIKYDNIEVVFNGVSNAFRPADKETIDQTAKDLKLPSGRYVLSLGSLEPRKNLPRLLAGWAKVVDSFPDDISLVIAGGKGNVNVFGKVDFDNIPKRVHFTGRVPENLLPSLYTGAMGFAYMSVYEGFGIPPLEAMACGVPVLVGNRTSIPEIVGRAAIMVDPFSIDKIADGLSHLVNLSDADQARYRELGLLQVQKFNWNTAAEKMIQIFNRIQ